MSKNDKTNNNVAIVFDDLTEFFVMRPAIDHMKHNRISVDIIVPYDSGYNGLAEHTFDEIDQLGYHPLKDAPKSKEYKVLLTPYPNLNIVRRTKYTYHLKYPYGPISAKPDPVFLPEWKISYDGIITFNIYEPNFLSAYGTKYHIVPYWRYQNFKKIPTQSTKPNLLILSTFGAEVSNIKLFTKSAINDIKKHYNIISKAHHAIHFSSDNKDSLAILKNISDEFYDSDTPIIDLLKRADIVLSDNSGAIFDSIYTGIPVALFCKNPNQRKLGPINTLQYNLVNQGILPHVTEARNVLPMLKSIKPYIAKQAKVKRKLFPEFKDDSPSEFTKIIQEYLSKNPNEDYYKAIHSLLVDELNSLKATIKQHESTIHQQESALHKSNSTINELKTTIQELESNILKLQQLNDSQSTTIQELYNSTSWKITKPLRKLKELSNKERS